MALNKNDIEHLLLALTAVHEHRGMKVCLLPSDVFTPWFLKQIEEAQEPVPDKHACSFSILIYGRR